MEHFFIPIELAMHMSHQRRPNSCVSAQSKIFYFIDGSFFSRPLFFSSPFPPKVSFAGSKLSLSLVVLACIIEGTARRRCVAQPTQRERSTE
jgi:hypothetical protein